MNTQCIFLAHDVIAGQVKFRRVGVGAKVALNRTNLNNPTFDSSYGIRTQIDRWLDVIRIDGSHERAPGRHQVSETGIGRQGLEGCKSGGSWNGQYRKIRRGAIVVPLIRDKPEQLVVD